MRRILPYSLICLSGVQISKSESEKSEAALKRRTELPVYSEAPKVVEKNIDESVNPMAFDLVKSFRIEACKVARAAQSVSDRCKHIIDTGYAHSYGSYANAVEYLREEKNLLQRFGAISGGFAVGYILGWRRGFIKRSLYASTGALTVAAVCYPNEAKFQYQKLVQSSKRYTVIGYHFANGVSKDLLGFELPALPLKSQNSESQESSNKTEVNNNDVKP